MITITVRTGVKQLANNPLTHHDHNNGEDGREAISKQPTHSP